MLKFVFTFHIFVIEGSLVNRIDSQFVFDSLAECRTAEMVIQKVKDPGNCYEKLTDQKNNNAVDNLDLMIGKYNSTKREKGEDT